MTTPCQQTDKINAIYEALVGTLTEPGIRTLLSEVQKDHAVMKKTLFGNGSPGIVEVVNGLRIQHEGEEKSWGKSIAIGTLLITNAVAILVPYLGKHP